MVCPLYKIHLYSIDSGFLYFSIWATQEKFWGNKSHFLVHTQQRFLKSAYAYLLLPHTLRGALGQFKPEKESELILHRDSEIKESQNF